jgi:hypothetical protein
VNTALIPQFDMLGLPIPVWIAQALTVLTLALHWAFLATAIGGALTLLVARWLGQRDPALRVQRAVVPALPLCLSLAMTIGVAPLLFAQVLYGNFFYVANILQGWWWLGLLGIVIVIFYLLYNAWRHVASDRPAKSRTLLTAVVLAVVAGTILIANATLTQTPEAWEQLRPRQGSALYMGDKTFAMRLALAVSALAAGGGIFVGALSRIRLKDNADALALGVRAGTLVSRVGFLGITAVGAWALLAGSGTIFALLLGGVGLLGAALVWAGKQKGLFLLPAGVLFVGLLAIAVIRQVVREAALAKYMTADVPVHAQWDSFTAFLVVFVIGLGVIGYLIKLALTREAPTS